MIYAVRCLNLPDTQDKARAYMKKYKTQIKEIRRHRMIPVILLNSGDELHFVTQFTWSDWCKGKTYQFIGENTTYKGKNRIKTQNTD